MEFLTKSWHWSFSGFMIVVVMFLLIYTGKRFGVSSSFRAICNIAGGGRISEYFNYNWKDHSWLLLFVVGSIIGGYLAGNILPVSAPLELSQDTVSALAELGVAAPGSGGEHQSLLPESLFSIDSLMTLKGFILFVVGGFLIGFGTRWAGGCTSGHAISGLSNLQMPSLVAVIGFFIGGLFMTHLLFPLIFAL